MWKLKTTEHFGFWQDSYYTTSNKSEPSVLLIEDREHLDIVFDDGIYDRHVLESLIPASQGKMSMGNTGDSDRVLRIGNVGTLDPRRSYLVACTNESTIAIFVTTSYFRGPRHVMYAKGKRVAYTHDTHLVILERILRCFEMNIADVVLVKLDQVPSQVEMSLPLNCDILFMMVNPTDPSLTGLLQSKLALCSYRDIDQTRAMQLLPWAQLREKDVVKLFPRTVPARRVEVFLECKNVMYTDIPFHSYLLDYVVQYYITNFGYVNYFNRFLKSHPRTELFVARINKEYTVDTSNAPILEQFSEQRAMHPDRRLRLTPLKKLDGFYIPQHMTFYYRSDVLDGVPMMIGDFVELKYQDIPEENGMYTVSSVSLTEGCRLQKFHHPYRIRSIPNEDGFYCVTDPSIMYKHECLAGNDVIGNKRHVVNVWDGPCKDSHECPFFTYDPSTKQYHGRCVNGYCQMPQGVTRVGFRKYVV